MQDAVFGLGVFGILESIPALTELIYKNGSDSVVREAVVALYNLDPTHCIPVLLRAFRNRPSVRKLITHVMYSLSPNKAVESMIEYTFEENNELRTGAVLALSEIESGASVDRLGNLLSDLAPTENAVELFYCDNPKCCPEGLKSIRDAARYALDRIGTRKAQILLLSSEKK